MRFVDLFCGIGGFRLGLEANGHEHAQSAEFAEFPRSVYAARFGDPPTWRDVREITPREIEGGPGVVWAGGFPCQDASSAGLGLGLLGGKRSSLVFRVLGLAAVARPEWLFLENVPGLLVRGRGFDRLLGVLARLGYGFCWRVLDAQHFGVAQRRRRVFIVACLGARAGMRRAAEVLAEPEGLRGDPPPRGEAGAGPPRAAQGGSGGGRWSQDVSPALTAALGHHGGSSPRGDGSTPLVAGFNSATGGPDTTGWTPGLSPPVRGSNPPAAVIPFNAAQVTSPHNRNKCEPGEPAHTLSATGVPETVARADGAWVRRLTPRECERLQGFPDDWTAIPGATDGPRYKAVGNAVAVPVIDWIAGRLPQ